MATTTIKMSTNALVRTGDEKLWELRLEPVDEVGVVAIQGELADLKKMLGKTFEARVIIGAEDEPAGDAGKLAEDLRVEKVLTMDLRSELDRNQTRLKDLEEQLEKAKASAPATSVGPNDPKVQIIRGNLRTIHENAEANTNAGKATESAKWGQTMRQARLAIEALEQLVGPGKTPALKLASVPTPVQA